MGMIQHFDTLVSVKIAWHTAQIAILENYD
jgi:hypothetical protein